ncbi:MAG: PQQ-binding-like beta-propeller repeat protein [Candidatus Eremiobacterota bacterium]
MRFSALVGLILLAALLAGHDPVRAESPAHESVRGVLAFRGGSTRTRYGVGPVPRKPRVVWKRWLGSRDGWAGTGWTGQPAVVEWPKPLAAAMFPGGPPRAEVIVGGLCGSVFFFDGDRGTDSRPPLRLPGPGSIKGSVTVDPDGFPLLYVGNRGGRYCLVSLLGAPRVVATIDGRVDPRSGTPTDCWPDFDGSGLVVGGDLLVGGENCWFYRIPLQRSAEHPVPPRKQWKTVYTPTVSGLAREALDLSNSYASLESSPTVFGDRVYVAAGNGMVLGFHRKTLGLEFQYHTGDDTDATVVVDSKGFLYVACQSDYHPRRQGILFKLNPAVPPHRWKEARVWSRSFAAYPDKGGPGHQDNLDAGFHGTPALGPGPDGTPQARLYACVTLRPGRQGRVMALDTRTGKTIWERDCTCQIWASPVLVDGKLLVAEGSGVLRCLRASDGKELWHVQLGGVLESTPVVWRGWIYVGARDGRFYALHD